MTTYTRVLESYKVNAICIIVYASGINQYSFTDDFIDLSDR